MEVLTKKRDYKYLIGVSLALLVTVASGGQLYASSDGSDLVSRNPDQRAAQQVGRPLYASGAGVVGTGDARLDVAFVATHNFIEADREMAKAANMAVDICVQGYRDTLDSSIAGIQRSQREAVESFGIGMGQLRDAITMSAENLRVWNERTRQTITSSRSVLGIFGYSSSITDIPEYPASSSSSEAKLRELVIKRLESSTEIIKSLNQETLSLVRDYEQKISTVSNMRTQIRSTEEIRLLVGKVMENKEKNERACEFLGIAPPSPPEGLGILISQL